MPEPSSPELLSVLLSVLILSKLQCFGFTLLNCYSTVGYTISPEITVLQLTLHQVHINVIVYYYYYTVSKTIIVHASCTVK